jgi:hypothetical protein
MAEASERLGRLEVRMDLVERGVANFRDFQEDARDFFSRQDEREKIKDQLDKRRSRIHFALLGGLISLVVGLIIAAFTWAASFESRHKVVSQHDVPGLQSNEPSLNANQ